MRAIALFAKAPAPGKVKTRLTTSLTPLESSELHASFVIDTLTEMSAMSNVDIFLACHPTTEDSFFMTLEKRFRLKTMKQKGEHLGERMKNVFYELKSMGYKKVVIIGSDSPTLPYDIVENAFESLEKNELVLGPSLDGGYYLIALAGHIPDIFDGIKWGSDEVFEGTLRKAKRQGLDMHILPFWYDVDTIRDLRFLSIHLAGLDESICVETRLALKKIGKAVNCPF